MPSIESALSLSLLLLNLTKQVRDTLLTRAESPPYRLSPHVGESHPTPTTSSAHEWDATPQRYAPQAEQGRSKRNDLQSGSSEWFYYVAGCARQPTS